MNTGRSSSVRWSVRSKPLGDPDFFSQLGKVPPQAVEIEEAVLGALMLERDALSNVIEILKPESFYKEAHQEIYSSILELFKGSEPVDILTVTNHLRKKGKLDAVGGPYYITNLTSRVNSSANTEYHSRIITELSIKRELIRISTETQQDAYDESTDVFNLLDKTEQSLFDISETNIRKNYDSMRSLMGDAIREIEKKKNLKTTVTGVPSGFIGIDRITSGWQKSDLVIIAARPGMGKTAFALSAIRNAAVDFEKAVAIFTLEMSSIQLVNRLISAEAELESDKIRKGLLEEYEWEQLVYKTSKLTEARIFIDDTPALTILELRAKSRRLVSQHHVELIVVDYLQLMAGETSRFGGAGNREQEIASISRALKNLAKELNVPVIALSQLSRAVETRGGDKRPQLSDLRESGSIEQDADLVLFLYRPEYYGFSESDSGQNVRGMCELIIAKHRNGSVGSVNLKFITHFTKFAELTDDTGGAGSINQPNPNYLTLQSKINHTSDKGQGEQDVQKGGGNIESAPF
jgi:replicative DNA helicase